MAITGVRAQVRVYSKPSINLHSQLLYCLDLFMQSRVK